ncbi:MAG: hypothetical protein ABFE13_02740 [Phycisphaerales bacterium]
MDQTRQFQGDRHVKMGQGSASTARLVMHVLCPVVVLSGMAAAADRYTWPDLLHTAQRWLRDAPMVGFAGQDDFPLPEVMGLVTDSEGRPLSCVLVGKDDLTDLNGVYSGSAVPSPAGWIQLDAWGYATGYARLDTSYPEVDLFLAWMTPFQALGKVEPGESVQLIADANDGIVLTAVVVAEDLSETPAYVGLADVNVLDVGPLSAPLRPEEDLYLICAFAFQAFDATGQAVPSADGHTFTVHIEGLQTPELPKLAWLDPNAGQWIVLEDVCQATGDNVIACTLPKLWPLYGLFVPGEAPYLLVPDPLGSPPQGLRLAGDEMPGSQYKSLYQALGDRWRRLEDDQMAGKPVDPCNDPAIRSILEQMAQIARDEAARQRNETGKMHLLWVAARAMLACQDDLASSLMDMAIEITNEIASRLLNEGDCGRLREMLHALDQLQAFGGDQAMEQALREKIQRLLASCDVWTGTIHYIYPISRYLPLTGDEYVLHSGSRLWMEAHDVRMATHAETHILMGEVRTRLSFPWVRYVEREPPPMHKDCPDFHDVGVFQDNPLTYDTDNWLYFDGTYDGYTFQVGPPVPASDAKPAEIRHSHVSRSVDGDGQCSADAYTDSTPYPNEFYSALIHSFMFLMMSPSITMQEMLETGMHNDIDGYETIRGSEPIANPMPMPNHGLYPFTEGEVIWNLIHVQRLLPFEP